MINSMLNSVRKTAAISHWESPGAANLCSTQTRCLFILPLTCRSRPCPPGRTKRRRKGLFFCVIMPKILIVSIPPLPALLDQASGSAPIPADQQKYPENPVIPLKLRELAANSLLDLKVSFHSTAQTCSRPNQPLRAWEQGGFSREKDGYW